MSGKPGLIRLLWNCVWNSLDWPLCLESVSRNQTLLIVFGFNASGLFSVSASSTSMTKRDPPTWQLQGLISEGCEEGPATFTSTPLKLEYVCVKHTDPTNTGQPCLGMIEGEGVMMFVSRWISCLRAAAASRTLEESPWSWMMIKMPNQRRSVSQGRLLQTNSQVRHTCPHAAEAQISKVYMLR